MIRPLTAHTLTERLGRPVPLAEIGMQVDDVRFHLAPGPPGVACQPSERSGDFVVIIFMCLFRAVLNTDRMIQFSNRE